MSTALKVAIESVEYQNDIKNGSMTNTIGEFNSASSFVIMMDNVSGRWSNTFNIGNEIEISISDFDSISWSKRLVGIIEKINKKGGQNNNTITLSGRDYSARLQDLTIPPEVYNNQDAGDIIDDLITKYGEDITYSKSTLGNIQRITFNQISLFDGIKKICDQLGLFFYVDVNKVLQVKVKGTTSSGVTLDKTNTTKFKWTESRADMYNSIWVYGGKYLTGYDESFVANGGSEFTLAYKPHNTEVFASGLIQVGGISQMNVYTASGVNYVADYYNQKIIFVSGTLNGDIPASGVDIDINYQRDSALIKYGRDVSSINAYGKREKIIQEPDITDPQEAEELLKSQIDLYSTPRMQGGGNIENNINLIAGDTIIANFPNDGVTNQVYDILEVKYDFNPKALISDNVVSVKLNKKVKEFTDTVKEMILNIKALQSANSSDSDLLTRYEFFAGSCGLRANYNVQKRDIGSLFYLNHSTNSLLNGSYVLDALNAGSFYTVKSGGDY